MLSYFKNLFSFKTKPKPLDGLKGIALADGIFHNLVVTQKVPGLSCTILKGGERLLQKGYGYADLEAKIPIDPKNSLIRIASVSKCITGLALGKAVEDGLVEWDDSFYKHVPYYPQKAHDFSLRQLAGHTAGIRGYRGKEYGLNKPYGIKESITVFKDDSLVFEPGTSYLYNSFDFVLLSLALQEASGIPFETYVREKVLLPLGMENTISDKVTSTSLSNHGKSDSIAERSRSYTRTANGFQKAMEVNNYYKLAGGGYLSTSLDIAQMGQAILEERLLKEETYDQLFTSQTVNGKSTYYGLGFQVSEDAQGRKFVGHVGNSVGAYSNFFVYAKERLIISILINCTNPNIQDALDKAIRALCAAGEESNQ